MTTVRLPRGSATHLLDASDPTATVCGKPAATTIVVDGPVTCRRCKERRK